MKETGNYLVNKVIKLRKINMCLCVKVSTIKLERGPGKGKRSLKIRLGRRLGYTEASGGERGLGRRGPGDKERLGKRTPKTKNENTMLKPITL